MVGRKASVSIAEMPIVLLSCHVASWQRFRKASMLQMQKHGAERWSEESDDEKVVLGFMSTHQFCQ